MIESIRYGLWEEHSKPSTCPHAAVSPEPLSGRHVTIYVYIHVSQGFDTLLVHYSIHHFMNEEIVSCEREPYFDQLERGPYHRIQVFLIDKPCM